MGISKSGCSKRITKTDLDHAYKQGFADCAKILGGCQKELQGYKDKEKQGLQVSLPCKDGDRVWYVDEYESSKIVGGTVDGYLWFRSCGFALNVVWDEPIMGPFAYMRKEMPFSEIGKTVFLSYKEAEAAMLKKDNK